MKRIPLRARDGSVREWVTVDDEDYDWLMQWKWHYRAPWSSRTGYALRTQCGDGKKKAIMMHRLIGGAMLGEDVDHRDRNGLNNCRDNLRPCTRSQNKANEELRSSNKSGYKGVSWDKSREKWAAQICDKGKMIKLGRFDSAEDAARAYDRAALERWGEFALPNFPANSSEQVA